MKNYNPHFPKQIIRSLRFIKNYRKRILKSSKLVLLFEESLSIFVFDRQSELINDHQLKGKMSHLRSFSIDQDYRVIYRERDNDFLFLDVGTHEEVYC